MLFAIVCTVSAALFAESSVEMHTFETMMLCLKLEPVWQSGSRLRQTLPSRVVSGLCLGRWLKEVTTGGERRGNRKGESSGSHKLPLLLSSEVEKQSHRVGLRAVAGLSQAL